MEDQGNQVFSKIEPIDIEDEDVKTTVLRNVQLIDIQGEHVLTGEFAHLGNSDGNLEINTISHVTEIIEQEEDDDDE